MSSDDPQNTEQPGEFEDFENENAPNQDPAPATTPPEPAPSVSPPSPSPSPSPTPASPPQPGLTKSDQSPQPADKADPAEIQKKEAKNLQEQLERLREERKNQEVVISKLAEANTGLQKKFDSAEKQHKVQQESAVEVASKAAVRQVTKERDDERKSKKIYIVVMVAAVILLCLLAAHDFLLETGPKSNTATQQPVSNKSSQYGFMQELDTLLTESDATKNQKLPNNNQGEKTQ